MDPFVCKRIVTYLMSEKEKTLSLPWDNVCVLWLSVLESSGYVRLLSPESRSLGVSGQEISLEREERESRTPKTKH